MESGPNWRLNVLVDDTVILSQQLQLDLFVVIISVDKDNTITTVCFNVDCLIPRSPVVRLNRMVLTRSTAYSHHPLVIVAIVLYIDRSGSRPRVY